MTPIRFVDSFGVEHIVEAEVGESVMRCATRALIPGIIGECGGAGACGTCHTYVLPAGRVPPPSRAEQEMVEGCIDARPESRLCCQIVVAPHLGDVTFMVPASQV